MDLYNGFNGLRHRINWTYFTVLDGLAHPLYSVNENKIYIFNFDTNQQTQDFYDLLCKKVDKVGVHILSESAHHYKASNSFGQSQVIHYSEPLNPRRESLQILK